MGEGYLPLGTGGVSASGSGGTPPGQTFHSETVTAADGMHPTGMHSCYASPLSQAQHALDLPPFSNTHKQSSKLNTYLCTPQVVQYMI